LVFKVCREFDDVTSADKPFHVQFIKNMYGQLLNKFNRKQSKSNQRIQSNKQINEPVFSLYQVSLQSSFQLSNALSPGIQPQTTQCINKAHKLDNPNTKDRSQCLQIPKFHQHLIHTRQLNFPESLIVN